MAGGTRTGFNSRIKGGPNGYTFKIRYGRHSKFQVAAVYMPYGWTTPPNIATQPVHEVLHGARGGTWYNPGLDALGISGGSFMETVALSVSNKYHGVVIISDYRPSGYTAEGEDIERVYWPDMLKDAALSVQFFRTIADIDSIVDIDGNTVDANSDPAIWDRPLTTDPDFTACFGSSSGAQRQLFAQVQPDGTFPYAPRPQDDNVYAPRFSHICNPIVFSGSQSVFSGFNKGGSGYQWFESYGEWSWAGPTLGSDNDLDWDDIPMRTKRQMDLGEYAVADNPRMKEIGVYFTGAHISGETPRGSIVNDPTGVDPRSFKQRYWRYTGGPPAPIGNYRPIVDDVESIKPAPADQTAKFRRLSGTWAGDGYEVGDIIVTDGFGGTTNNDFEVTDPTANGGLDLVVSDPDDEISDNVSASGQTVAGGGLFSLHDEAHSYIGYDEVVAAGSTKSRLRAGSVKTNPDYLTTGNSVATKSDAESWLETEFGWTPYD